MGSAEPVNGPIIDPTGEGTEIAAVALELKPIDTVMDTQVDTLGIQDGAIELVSMNAAHLILVGRIMCMALRVINHGIFFFELHRLPKARAHGARVDAIATMMSPTVGRVDARDQDLLRPTTAQINARAKTSVDPIRGGPIARDLDPLRLTIVQKSAHAETPANLTHIDVMHHHKIHEVVRAEIETPHPRWTSHVDPVAGNTAMRLAMTLTGETGVQHLRLNGTKTAM